MSPILLKSDLPETCLIETKQGLERNGSVRNPVIPFIITNLPQTRSFTGTGGIRYLPKLYLLNKAGLIVLYKRRFPTVQMTFL